ncbi:type VI secretion system baseplate subunit TssF [Pendulispora albinea]|uniref:Type VI secretion system baseplate subunit TssF n=1 Tax=Pendulispora albinea TaxID=2741071 RepID=A0ABZ2M400_9BACT
MFRYLVESALNEVWDGFQELAEQYPRLAPLLARDVNDDVTELAQSTAFVLASIDERLHDDGQTLLRPLVARALPECLRPRPSSTILELPPSATHSDNAQGATFEAGGAPIPLPFVVVWPVHPGPYAIQNVRVDRPNALLQTLHVVLVGRDGVSLGNVLPERIRFFVHVGSGGAARAIELLHALRTARDPIAFATFDSAGRPVARGNLPPDAFAWVRVDTDEPSLVSAPVDRFRASSLLRDLFEFPESYGFCEILVGPCRSEKVARLELILPLGRVVEHASSMNPRSLRLFCAPATNQYEIPIEPLRAEAGPEWPLVAEERAHAEILHVQSIHAEGRDGPVPIVSLEAPDRPHPIEPGLLYYRLEQAIARDESRTIVRLSLANRDRFRAPAPGTLEGTVLASDGTRTQNLGVGDVGGRNITRVSPSRRAMLGLAMRMNAFARMSPRRFAEPAHLNAFLRLHAAQGLYDGMLRMPSCVHMTHRTERRSLSGANWQTGDDFTLRIESASCSDAEAWLQCKLLARAIAERNEKLRYSRLTVLREKDRGLEAFARYDPRDGERHSFPLG